MNILDEAKTARRMKAALKIRQKVMEADRKTGARTLRCEGGMSLACVRWRKGQGGQEQQEKQICWRQGTGGSRPRLDL